MRHPRAMLVVFLCAALGGAAADERSGQRVVHQQGADSFVAGGSARLSEAVRGDLIAAGGELMLAGPVAGDQIAFGGKLRFDGAVGQDLYGAGGQVALEGSVARNARLAGGDVSLGPRARVAGNASLAGGEVKVLGAVGGYLQAAGGRVLIDGRVDGDVDAASGALELGPHAVIGGRLRYRGGGGDRSEVGAAELRAELEELGAEVEIAACDVTEREQLERAIAAIPVDRPLGAVVHSAAVFDDGTLDSLDPARLAEVMRPKVDGAMHLHELTADLDLSHFLLFSSAAGLLGGAGQAAYATANVFCDALAAARDRAGEILVVCGDDDRPALRCQFLQGRGEVVAPRAIERGGGLIHQQDLRVDGKRTRNGDPLRLAAGQLVRHRGGAAADAERREQGLRAIRDSRTGQPERMDRS